MPDTTTLLEPPATPTRVASDALELPAIGFGTYKINGLTGVESIKSALHQGYRLLDSAFNYENEGAVGRAIRESGVPRDPDVARIAAKHGVSVVRVVLRWHLQLGDVALPKSAHAERQRANIDLAGFELDEQDMADIAAMDNPEGYTFGRTLTGTRRRRASHRITSRCRCRWLGDRPGLCAAC